MILKLMQLLILLVLLTRKRSQYYAQNKSDIGNIADLYNYPIDVINQGSQNLTRSPQTQFNQSTTTKTKNGAHVKDGATGIKSQTQSISRRTLARNATNITTHYSSVENLANLYSFNMADKVKNPNNVKNINKNSIPANNSIVSKNYIESYKQKKSPSVASLAELYFFPSNPSDVMGIFNCSYENTINISLFPALPNGSYIYDDHTVIPPHLVGNYDYKILYNGAKRSVQEHKRACICRLRKCITLCSDNIIEFYQDMVEDDESDDTFLSLFSVPTTLTNKTVVTKNIATDFEHIILDEFCVPYSLSPEKDKKNGWTLFENGTLLRHSDQVQLKKNEYCFELYQDTFGNETYYLINPFNCGKERENLRTIDKLNYWTQVFSIPFFVITIIAYCCLHELRNVHGKCFISYLSSVTMSYGLLSYINLSKRTFDPVCCLVLGYLNHYLQLSHYTWLGIICYDTWKCFTDLTYKSSYSKYAIYGYNLPFLMTLLTYAAQNSNIAEDWTPGINEYRCGLQVNKWAALIYLYGPCTVILAFGLVSFISTSRIIKSNWKEVTQISEVGFESAKSRHTLYLRLFLMMGLSWSLDVLSYLLSMCRMKSLSELIDYVNALQGFYIFINFIGRRRVRDIIRKRFTCIKF